ncbi:MAG: hypothetical protein WBD07_03875 [Vicinamibacterales bacterium]
MTLSLLAPVVGFLSPIPEDLAEVQTPLEDLFHRRRRPAGKAPSLRPWVRRALRVQLLGDPGVARAVRTQGEDSPDDHRLGLVHLALDV